MSSMTGSIVGPSWNRHDFSVVNAVARHSGWAHPLLTGYANYGVAVFALLLVAGWWVARQSGDPRRVGLALWAGAGTLLAVAVNQLVVNAVDEPRPYTVLPHALVLVSRSGDYSFPSDHAVMAGAVAAGLLIVSRRLGALAVAAALLMAFARVYVGAHWPADVIAGLLLGGLITVLGALAAPLWGWTIAMLARGPLRPLLLPAPGTPGP